MADEKTILERDLKRNPNKIMGNRVKEAIKEINDEIPSEYSEHSEYSEYSKRESHRAFQGGASPPPRKDIRQLSA